MTPAELFEEEGRSGGGYAWDSVTRIALRELPAPQRRGWRRITRED